MQQLSEFLNDQCLRIRPNTFLDNQSHDADRSSYRENVNFDALHAWLDRGTSYTSYIWKVGVLATWDSNKCDWVNIYIGHQRSPHHAPEFIGHLYYRGGENDDIGRCLGRYLVLLQDIHPVFECDLSLEHVGPQ